MKATYCPTVLDSANVNRFCNWQITKISIHISRKSAYEPRSIYLLPPGWDASPSQGHTPNIKFAGTHLYTWVERGPLRVECVPKEHKTMTPARARTQTAQSDFERTADHKNTAPPNLSGSLVKNPPVIESKNQTSKTKQKPKTRSRCCRK